MPCVHIGTKTLTNANTPLPLTTTRVMARQLFIQCNQAFSVGDSTVTPTTGILGSAVNAAGAAQNAPNTVTMGSTAGGPIINLNEVNVVSTTGGAVASFLYLP